MLQTRHSGEALADEVMAAHLQLGFGELLSQLLGQHLLCGLRLGGLRQAGSNAPRICHDGMAEP